MRMIIDQLPSIDALVDSLEEMNYLLTISRGLIGDRVAFFSKNNLGLSSVMCLEMKLLPDFFPKRLKAFKIPHLLQAEVSKQIDVMLKQDVIVPSKTPLVCVLKGPRG